MKWSGLKIGPTREEVLRNLAPDEQWTPRVPDTEVQLPFYIYVWHYGSSQARHTGSSFYVPGVVYICTQHSSCLICTSGVYCCSSISPLFYFLWLNFKKLYCCNRGTESCETTCRLLVKAWSKCLCAYLANIFWGHCPFKAWTSFTIKFKIMHQQPVEVGGVVCLFFQLSCGPIAEAFGTAQSMQMLHLLCKQLPCLKFGAGSGSPAHPQAAYA